MKIPIDELERAEEFEAAYAAELEVFVQPFLHKHVEGDGCQWRVSGYNGYHVYPCLRRGYIEVGDTRLCWQHSRVALRLFDNRLKEMEEQDEIDRHDAAIDGIGML